MPAEVHQDECLAAGSVKLRDGVESRHINDRKLRLKLLLLLGILFQNEHVAGKEVVPGVFGDDAHRHAETLIRTRITIEDEDVPILRVGQHLAQHRVKLLRLKGAVDLSPPDLIFGARFLNDELVVRRTAGVTAGAHHQRPKMNDFSFAASNDLFI